nr:TVP38/TMEM64 family protein [uncultured Dethiosulfovibrio sp.]
MTKKKTTLSVLALIITALIVRASGIQGCLLTEEGLSSLGKLAPYAFTAGYTLAVVLAVPGGPLTALAGALFGTFWGVIAVSIGSTIGACIAFLIARYLAKDRVSLWLSSKPAFSRMDRLITKRGWIMIAIFRLIPLFPFNLINYGMGLTSIPFRNYAIGSWFFMLPGTLVYVAGGDALVRSVREGEVPWRIVTMVVIVGLCLFLTSKRIREYMKEEQ